MKALEKHPAPWSVEPKGGNGADQLYDANGELVVGSSDEYEPIEFGGPVAYELIILAPEMASALHRLLEWMQASLAGEYGPANHQKMLDASRDAIELMRRLQAAKAREDLE